MKILVSSWEAVSAQIIVNCFRKAGITLEAAITDADDSFSDLKESLQQLYDIDPDMVLESITPESLIDVDKEVITTASMITDARICEVLQQINQNSLIKMMITMKKQRKRHQNDRSGFSQSRD